MISLLLIACTPPAYNELFNDVDVTIAPEAATVSDAFVDAITGADDSLHIALPAGEDTAVTDAIIAAWDRGLRVEVVTDIDRRDDPGIAALVDTGVPTTLADDGLLYFEFTVNRDVQWDSAQTVMSHAYIVADALRITTASSAGDLQTGPRVLLQLRGETIVEDLLTEHNQLFGGIDATSVTAFDSPAKSIADSRWSYPLAKDAGLEMWFGPQERLTKRVIDAVYGARSAVWILTDELANQGLAAALEEKAGWGFDVKVAVGPRFASTSPGLAQTLLDDTPNVDKVQVTSVDQLPTVVLIDLPPDAEGYAPMAKGMVITHSLVSSSRLYGGETVITDQLIDGALWVLTDTSNARTELLPLDALFRDYFDAGEPL